MDILRTVSLISVISMASVFGVTDLPENIFSTYENVIVSSWETIGYTPDTESDSISKPVMNFTECTDLYFTGVTDKAALSYAVGEDMIFTIAMHSGENLVSAPYFKYEITADDGTSVSGYTDGSSGIATLTASCSVPGFVKVTVMPCTSEKEIVTREDIYPFYGGACAGFDKIVKSMDTPSDFDEFWAKQVKLLDNVPASPTMQKLYEKHSYSQYDVYDVSIPSINGSKPTIGYVTVPKNSTQGSLKIRVMFMGYGVSPALIMPEPGYITFCINPHGIDNGMHSLYYKIFANNELSGFGFSGNENPEKSYFRDMILRDIQGVRYIKENYKYLWNGKDLEVAGASMGAFQATAVAALMKDDITRVILDIPWMCDLGSETKGRLGGWRPTYCSGLGYYDTVSFGKRVTAPTEITAGLGDYTCPPSGVAVLFNNLECEKKITFVQNRTHDYNPPKQTAYVHN